ncbi:MAG TPA: alpha/beta fold hydrolase [Anaerolineae bacterium]|nr:alpha/beta fold hydrolase [Anaerolineae bacterium]
MSSRHLLLLHGALSTAGQFDPLIPHLSDAFTLHRLTFDGHGDAPVGELGFTNAAFVQNVLDYLDAHRLAEVDIFGYSMGGYIACLVARSHPSRVRRIATLGTKYLWDEGALTREFRFLDPDIIRQKVPHFAQSLAQRHIALGWERVLALMKDVMRENAATGGLTPEWMSQLEQPLRIIVGDRDTTAGVIDSYRVFQALQQGQFEVLPQTPHPFEKVAMPKLAQSLNEFFL